MVSHLLDKVHAKAVEYQHPLHTGEKKKASVPVRDGNVHTIPYCGFLSWGKKFTNTTQNEGQGLHWLCGIQCYHACLQNRLLDCSLQTSETEATSTSLLYPSMLANNYQLLRMCFLGTE